MSRLGHKRDHIYPLQIKGFYQRRRNIVGHTLIVFLMVMPWVRIAGQQALLFDLDAGRFYVFGATFTPRDTLVLVLLGTSITFSLFFMTALFGRLWCGYACPQTVFLDSWIRPLDEWLEGSRSIRRQRDQGPMTFTKAWRKGLKWSLFALLSVGLSLTFTSYLTPTVSLWTGSSPGWSYGLTGFLSLLWFWDFTWFREQFCSYLCPYARFQSALTDHNSLVISYDTIRGDPRGTKKVRRLNTDSDNGDCMDCSKCVAVCPHGIDIRDGYQLECINCARCVDACTSVMAKLGKESLVRYSTEAHDQRHTPRSWMRGPTLIYMALLAGLVGTFLMVLLGRSTLDASVTRSPGTLFTVSANGNVRNTYLLSVTNSSNEAVDISVTLVEDYTLGVPPMRLEPTEMRSVPIVVQLSPAQLSGETMMLHLNISTEFEERQLETTFKSAGPSMAGS